jgi:hypothetical protein
MQDVRFVEELEVDELVTGHVEGDDAHKSQTVSKW